MSLNIRCWPLAPDSGPGVPPRLLGSAPSLCVLLSPECCCRAKGPGGAMSEEGAGLGPGPRPEATCSGAGREAFGAGGLTGL